MRALIAGRVVGDSADRDEHETAMQRSPAEP
jgi:hypothetical protein